MYLFPYFYYFLFEYCIFYLINANVILLLYIVYTSVFIYLFILLQSFYYCYFNGTSQPRFFTGLYLYEQHDNKHLEQKVGSPQNGLITLIVIEGEDGGISSSLPFKCVPASVGNQSLSENLLPNLEATGASSSPLS